MGPRRAAVWLCWLALTPLAGCRWLAAYEGAPDASMADAPRLPDSQLADAADLAMREDVRVKDVAVKDTYPFDARIFGDGGAYRPIARRGRPRAVRPSNRPPSTRRSTPSWRPGARATTSRPST